MCKEPKPVSNCSDDLLYLLGGLVGEVKEGLICTECLTLLKTYENLLEKLTSIERTIKGHFGLNETFSGNQFDQDIWHTGDQFYAITNRKGNNYKSQCFVQ